MNKKFLFTILFLILLSNPVYSLNYTVIYEESNFLPNQTADFLILNITEENFTFDNLTISILQSPFDIHWNYTSNKTLEFYVKLPEYFEIGNFDSKILFFYNNDPSLGRVFTINVISYTNWIPTFNDMLYEFDLNVGDIKEISIPIDNLGNTEVLLELYNNDTCSDFFDFNRDKKIYPFTTNNIFTVFEIPIDLHNQVINCSLLIMNKVNLTDNNTIDFRFNITDNVKPIIKDFNFIDGMAIKPLKFDIFTKDNVGISELFIELVYENYSFWDINGTRYEVYKNISLGRKNFTQIDEDLWSYTFFNTDLIGKYYLNITASDIDGNIAMNRSNFKIIPLDTITYNQSLESGFLEIDNENKFKLLSTDYKIPVKIGLNSFQILEDVNGIIKIDNDGFFTDLNRKLKKLLKIKEAIIDEEIKNLTYILGIEDFEGNKHYFQNEDDIFEFNGNGDIHILFTSNTAGRFIANFNITTVEQHIPIENIVLSIKTIEGAKPFETYSSTPVPEIKIDCDLISTGDLLTSRTECKSVYKWPYLLSNENLPLLKTLGELDKERSLWLDNIANKDNIITGYKSKETFYIFIILILSTALLYLKFLHPIIIITD